jgi:CRP-like cAMP-binding protein
MKNNNSGRSDVATLNAALQFSGNRLLASLKPAERAILEPSMQVVLLSRGDVLFDAGEDVTHTHFPGPGVVASLVITMADGRAVESATIGREGAIGGIVSAGHKPAFARAVVQIGGTALKMETSALEAAKERSGIIRDLFSRYADTLLAQTMQSVACNALHSIDARLCRWLLTTHDRVDSDEIALTQEYLAEMLGVQRTTVSGVARVLQERGLISYSRGRMVIIDRPAIEACACECYAVVQSHLRAVLPDVKPQKVVDTKTGTNPT